MTKIIVKKDKYPVVIKLVDTEVISGFIYLQPGERLVDMMNDDRKFLPFEADDKDMYVLNKDSISKIKLGF